MYIREITAKEKQIVDNVVNIHINTFKGFFLTFMGKGFLRQMYRSYCEHKDSNLLVAFDDDNNPLGFVGYSNDMSGLYKFMIKRRLIKFAWYSFGAFLRKPKIFMRLIRAFLKPSESSKEEKYVEIATIGVNPDIKSNGIGSKLIDAVKERVDFTQYEYIMLETDAENNEGANHFYVKNGFVLERDYETRDGRKMNEYKFRKEGGV